MPLPSGRNALSRKARLLWADRRAVTALEYATIGMLIAVTILTAVAHLGTSASGLYQRVVQAFGAAGMS